MQTTHTPTPDPREPWRHTLEARRLLRFAALEAIAELAQRTDDVRHRDHLEAVLVALTPPRTPTPGAAPRPYRAGRLRELAHLAQAAHAAGALPHDGAAADALRALLAHGRQRRTPAAAGVIHRRRPCVHGMNGEGARAHG